MAHLVIIYSGSLVCLAAAGLVIAQVLDEAVCQLARRLRARRIRSEGRGHGQGSIRKGAVARRARDPHVWAANARIPEIW